MPAEAPNAPQAHDTAEDVLSSDSSTAQEPAKPFYPEQALTLAQALTAYTAGSAWVNHLDDVTGTVEVGKYADLVVLDRDPFERPALEIADTRVLRTYIDGRLVFAATD